MGELPMQGGQVDNMIIQCCVCRKFREGERWVETEPPSEPSCRISHTYCPACAADMFEQIRKDCERLPIRKPAKLYVPTEAPKEVPRKKSPSEF